MFDEYSAVDFLERCLYEAILDRDGRAAIEFILLGADPSLEIMGRPVIHHAISMEDEELLECAIANGADVHEMSEREGLAPLHFAVREKFVAGVKTLLKEQVDIELRDDEGISPLIHAVYKPNREIFNMLLASGADVNGTDDEGRTPLHLSLDHWQVVELLERGADVNARTFHNSTPLELKTLESFASYSYIGNPIVTEFVRWGAVIDETTLDAIFILARDKDCELELLTMVFRGTGYVYFRDECLRTALHYVAGTGRVEAVRELLECGADVNARDNTGLTPLHFAVGFNAGIEVVSELILEGSDVNARSRDERTPLHVGVISTSERVVEHLLQEGADINALDKKGESPLHRLIRHQGTSCMLRLLLKHSVLRNYDSRTQYVESEPWRKDFLSCIRYMAEIEDMKRFQVGRGFTLYDVSLGDEWDISFTSKVYDRMVKGGFPMYSDIVLSRLSRKVKEHLTDHATDVSLFLIDLSRKRNICINQHVLIDIVKYLSDEDCLNFYVAGCLA